MLQGKLKVHIDECVELLLSFTCPFSLPPFLPPSLHSSLSSSLPLPLCDADLIQSLLISAMSDCDLHQLSCGLLLARQSSLEGSHLFPSYPQWFQVSLCPATSLHHWRVSSSQATFGGGVDSVVSGKKQLLFLLKCLTKLAPHEPIFALKVCFSPGPEHHVRATLLALATPPTSSLRLTLPTHHTGLPSATPS